MTFEDMGFLFKGQGCNENLNPNLVSSELLNFCNHTWQRSMSVQDECYAKCSAVFFNQKIGKEGLSVVFY